jgi:crossover junction endodeoxyribonuclease RuvC
MIFLGIDPGIARMGYGVIDARPGTPTMLSCGCIETPKTMAKEARLCMIYTELTAVIAQYQVCAAGIERLYFSKNVTTALSVGEARGVALLALGQACIPIIEVDPGSVKQALTGYGAADKKQMQQMIKTVFKLGQIPKPDDAADALAIAYTASLMYRLG